MVRDMRKDADGAMEERRFRKLDAVPAERHIQGV